jgi:hypothetical protein
VGTIMQPWIAKHTHKTWPLIIGKIIVGAKIPKLNLLKSVGDKIDKFKN